MELKEKLIKNISVETNIPILIVEKVLSFIGKKTFDSFNNHSSIELSGFGTLKVSQAKLRRKKNRIITKIQEVEEFLTKEENDTKLKESRALRLKGYNKQLALLNQKENV